jgi:putative ATP-binding cassette transporter
MSEAIDTYRPNVFQLIAPFWISRGKWKAWALLMANLMIIFGGVYLAVFANRLLGRVVDAMVRRQWSHLWPVLLLALAVSVLNVIVAVVDYIVRQLLQLRWRTWMTEHYLSAWAAKRAYYEVERDGLLSNADQRISEDIPQFILDTLSLSLGLIRMLALLVSFTVVLWNLSGTLSVTIGHTHIAVPGYMVYIAFVYQAIALLITHYTGRPLIGLFMHQQTVEADFRYQGMQLRENAEQIAFYRGGERERQHLSARFKDIISNWMSIIVRTSKMTFFRDTYMQTGTIVPTLAALPRYLSGAMTLGGVTRVTGAFNEVSAALSFFTQAYVTYSSWLARGHRLRDLSWALSRAEKLPRGIAVERHSGTSIETSRITLRRPSGKIMVEVHALHLGPGERWLIRGRSGVGKSSFLRLMAGMWPYGQGKVKLPAAASLMFLPQRSYIPYGSLKAALCYPAPTAHFSDERCGQVLVECLLDAYRAQLDVVDRWQQKLSGGEQQRLAVARVLLHRPDFVFMDEATSALDGDTEAALYAAILGNLPGSAVISVAHRKELEALHDHVLELKTYEAEMPGQPFSPLVT